VLTTLLDTAAGWPVPVVLAVLATLLAVETGTLAGMAVPGTTVLVTAGLWSGTAGVPLVAVLLVAATATVTGALSSWYRTQRRPVRTDERRSPKALVATARGFAAQGRAGQVALLAGGHWASAARALVPRVAARAGTSAGVVVPVLVVSGTCWAAAVLLLARRLGPPVLDSVTWAPAVLVLLLALGLVVADRVRSRGRTSTGRGRRRGSPLGVVVAGVPTARRGPHPSGHVGEVLP